MGVSKNSGIPKSSILIGFSLINHPFWGTPILGNTQIQICRHRFLEADVTMADEKNRSFTFPAARLYEKAGLNPQKIVGITSLVSRPKWRNYFTPPPKKYKMTCKITPPVNMVSSRKLTWLAGKSPFLNSRCIFKWLCFHCHVSFRGCNVDRNDGPKKPHGNVGRCNERRDTPDVEGWRNCLEGAQKKCPERFDVLEGDFTLWKLHPQKLTWPVRKPTIWVDSYLLPLSFLCSKKSGGHATRFQIICTWKSGHICFFSKEWRHFHITQPLLWPPKVSSVKTMRERFTSFGWACRKRRVTWKSLPAFQTWPLLLECVLKL